MKELKYVGLTEQQVQDRRMRGRVNAIDDNISKTKKQIVFEYTFNYFNLLNIFLAIIIILTGKWTNLAFMGVVISNSVIGIFQEFKVKSLIDQLSVVTTVNATVVRNNKKIEIPVNEIVLDDIVHFESGDQIVTDCQILESFSLEVNESLLTGESVPIKKQVDDELMSGSFVVAGSCYAKVIRVGNDNYSSQLVLKAKHKNKASSKMKNAIEKIIKVLSVVIIPVGIILYISQLSLFPNDVSMAVVKTIGGVIGMIPEGLVLLTSLSFILGVGILAQKNALIQEMEAIESLARVDTLCLDKTGTITSGELKVESVDCLCDISDKELNDIMGCIAYAFDDVNVTQRALQNYYKPSSLIIKNSIPFSSQRKMSTVEIKDKGTYFLGAVEYLTEDKNILNDAYTYFEQGLRVLLLVINKDSFNQPLALISISDCIKEDAKETLTYFEREGVDVKIISGDNPVTVSQIALRAGVKNSHQYIDASSLPENLQELANILKDCSVIGRVKPEQKQLIVKALQIDNHVVGMVGDGVNDVLAIKDADCGIAMAKGSDAARQAAHIVLLDSNFSSMKQIVNEGKRIISNIERVSSLYLNKTIYSTLLCVIFTVLHLTYPFTPIQLSLIGALAIGIPSFYLTLQKSSTDISEGFYKHIIQVAFPCAVTMVSYLLFITFLGQYFKFDLMMYSTYYIIVGGFISFFVVYEVFKPFDKIKICLFCLLISVFYIVLLLIPQLFNIYPIYNSQVIWTIPIAISSFLYFIFLKKIVMFIIQKYPYNR